MAWMDKKVNKVITVFGAVFFVVAAALIAWGVLHHEEVDLLRVCWVDNKAHYVGERPVEGEIGTCERPEELIWPQKQVPISFVPLASDGSPLAEDTPQYRVLKQTFSDSNAQVGCELFRVVASNQPSGVQIHFGQTLETGSEAAKRAPGYVTHTQIGNGEDRSLQGHIYIRSDVESQDRMLFLVLRHEAFHIAGLEHDDFTLSIMYPLTPDEGSPNFGGLPEMTAAILTDYDRARLRDLYCQ